MMDLLSLRDALPEVIGTDAQLDALLRRLGHVPDWDGARLSLLRHTVWTQRLVARDDSGRIVRAERPVERTWVEQRNDQLAQDAERVRRERELAAQAAAALVPDDHAQAYALLSDSFESEQELDDELARIYSVPSWNRARIQGLRAEVKMRGMVIQDEEGRFVRAAGHPYASFTDARLRALEAEVRALRAQPA